MDKNSLSFIACSISNLTAVTHECIDKPLLRLIHIKENNSCRSFPHFFYLAQYWKTY